MTDEIPILISHLNLYRKETTKHLVNIRIITTQIKEAERNLDFFGKVKYCNKCGKVLLIKDNVCPVCHEYDDVIENTLEDHIKMLLRGLTSNRNLFDNFMDEFENFEYKGQEY